MEKVTMFKTVDGKVFATEAMAEAHESFSALSKRYAETTPVACSDEPVKFEDLMYWMAYNSELAADMAKEAAKRVSVEYVEAL